MNNVASSWMTFAQRPREQGGLGLQPHQAAGLVGNLVNESGSSLNPWGPTGDNGTAWGTAQWRGDRLANLRQRFPDSYQTTEGQQAFMRHEFDTSENRAWQALQSAKTPEEAAAAVNRFYERSADNSGRREAAARALFSNSYADDSSPLASSAGVQAINAATGNKAGPTMAFAGDTPPPDDGFMGSMLSRITGQSNGSGGSYDLGDAMANAGASMMALDNAKGAAVLAAMQQSNRKTAGRAPEWSVEPKSGVFYRTGPDGRLQTMKNPYASEEAKPMAKLSESALKHVDDQMATYDYLNQSATNAADILDDIKSGKLDLGAIKNMINSGQNMAGMSDEKSRAYAKYNQFITSLVNDNLRLNKGTQTEGDAYRELKALASNGTMYDNETAKEALIRSINKSMEAVTKRGIASLDAHKKAYGDEPFSSYSDMAQGWQNNFSSIRDRLQAAADAKAAAQAVSPAPAGEWKVMGVRRPK